MQGATTEKPISSRLTGAWERSGEYGTFYVGSFSLDDLNKAIANLGNGITNFEIVVSSAKKMKDTSPDMTITLRIPRVKGDQGVAGGTPSANVGASQAPRRAYGGGARK